jgi:hypothetical protein
MTMTRQARTGKPTAGVPRTLNQWRDLLDGMTGKTVRGYVVRSAVIEVSSRTWSDGYDILLYLDNRVGPFPQGAPFPVRALWAFRTLVVKSEQLHAFCATEGELLEVLRDPGNAAWYWPDEQ